jgi:hypothetical protein
MMIAFLSARVGNAELVKGGDQPVGAADLLHADVASKLVGEVSKYSIPFRQQ